MEELAPRWIDNQAAALITEPASTNYVQNRFVLFMSRDGEDAMNDLRDLGAKIEAEGNGKVEEIAFGERTIYQIPLGKFYEDVIGEGFSGLDSPYVARMNDVIVMGNSFNALRNLIGALDMKRSLASDPSFLEISDQIFDESNFILYSALARSPEIYSHILTEEHAKSLETQVEVLRKFQAFVYQVSHFKGDLYYNNVYLRHNPEYKQETNSLWELPLKASVSRPPVLLLNHYTNALETFIQDDSNRVYLVANTGKVLWERVLDGPVMGKVHQVDVYRNNKLQMLLNTPSSIYLLDRNGNDVERFPVKLESSASAPVSVADYDNSRDYRFFIGLENGAVNCYDITGQIVKGWGYAGGTPIATPLEHLRIRKKDYLFALDRQNRILLLNRRGNPRHQVANPAVGFTRGAYHVELGASISASSLYYVDSTGAAVRLGFDDRLDRVPVSAGKPIDYHIASMGEGSIVCSILDSEGWSLYTMDGERISKYPLDNADEGTLSAFELNEKSYFGICLPAREELLLLDKNANTLPGFPLFGSVSPAIGDMNRDGYYNLITAGREGYLYAYAIDLNP
jgi:hypothetical protein